MGEHKRERQIWLNMIRRCEDEGGISFHRYGGRGIRVCDRWRASFENFMADMGPCPSARYSLDRVDNDKGYGPNNCRWATKLQQARNKSPHILTLSAFAFADEDNAALLEEVLEMVAIPNVNNAVQYALRQYVKLERARRNRTRIEDLLGSLHDLQDQLAHTIETIEGDDDEPANDSTRLDEDVA